MSFPYPLTTAKPKYLLLRAIDVHIQRHVPSLMATSTHTLLRPPCFSSTNQFSTDPFSSSSHSFLSLCLSAPPFSSLSLSLQPKTKTLTKIRTPTYPFSFHSFCVSSSTQLELETKDDDEPIVEEGNKQEQQQEEEQFSKTRLIAQNVPWTCTAEDIRSLFEKHGTVVDVELSMHNKTRNRGLAFVEMGSPEEALDALNSLEGSEFEGRQLKVNYAKPRREKSPPAPQPKPFPTFNLFVANLSYEARSKDLKEFFDSGSGNVASAEVIFHDSPRRSSGYGFVAFKSKKVAEAALSDFQGKEFKGRPLRVARSKQFVKVLEKESLQCGDTSSELVQDLQLVEAAA